MPLSTQQTERRPPLLDRSSTRRTTLDVPRCGKYCPSHLANSALRATISNIQDSHSACLCCIAKYHVRCCSLANPDHLQDQQLTVSPQKTCEPRLLARKALTHIAYNRPWRAGTRSAIDATLLLRSATFIQHCTTLQHLSARNSSQCGAFQLRRIMRDVGERPKEVNTSRG